MEISAKLVKELRDKTSAGMMDCKKALKETNGDMEAAVLFLKEKGLMDASKREGKATREGVISIAISDDKKTGIAVEINCETDFVAKNEGYQEMCDKIAQKLVKDDAVTKDDINTKYESDIKEIIAKFSENTNFGAFKRVKVQDNGTVEAYVHAGSQVGVLTAFSFKNDTSSNNDEFKQLSKDVCMQIAATSPVSLNVDSVPEKFKQEQEEIFKKQLIEEGKKESIIDNIVKGKMNKYYQEVVLLEQPFVKENKITIKNLLAEKSKTVNDQLDISDFVRLQVGEEA